MKEFNEKKTVAIASVLKAHKLTAWQLELNELVQSKVMKMDYDSFFLPAVDMNHALEVVEKLEEMGYRFLVKKCGIHDSAVQSGEATTDQYFANFVMDSDEYLGLTKERYPTYADSPTEAICTAALKAVGGFLN